MRPDCAADRLSVDKVWLACRERGERVRLPLAANELSMLHPNTRPWHVSSNSTTKAVCDLSTAAWFTAITHVAEVETLQQSPDQSL